MKERESLFDDRSRIEALLRLRDAEDAQHEWPSDLPYRLAEAYMRLWDAYEAALADGESFESLIARSAPPETRDE